MKINRLFSVIILTAFLISCKIGNFMDMGDYDNNPLFLYALTVNELITYEIDTENGTLSFKGSITLPSIINESKLVYENEKHNLFVSHGDSLRYISGYSISDDGSLQLLSGYPFCPNGGNPVIDFIFDDNKSYLYGLAGGSIYSFIYEADGSITSTTPSTSGTYAGGLPAHIDNYDGYIFRQDSANSNTLYSITLGTGELVVQSNATPAINNVSTGALISSNGYICKIDGTVTPSTINSYSITGAVTDPKSSVDLDTYSSNINNALIKDPESRYLYFVSNAADKIFAIRTNEDGTVGALDPTDDVIQTGSAPNAAAIDPYKKFFFTAGTNGINIHRMDGDRPQNSYDNIVMTDQVLELIAVRSKN